MMEDFEREKRQIEFSLKMCVFAFIGLIIAMLVAVLFAGCSPRVVTVPEYHTEYVNRTDTFLRVDSFFNNTNTVIREANEGDSLLLAEYGIRLRDNERLLLLLRQELHRATSEHQEVHIDTFIKTDSIRVPYPVEKKLTRWQQMKVDLGEYVLVLLAVLAVLFIIRAKWKGITKQ